MATLDNKPTFHHLNNSQSQRIFWLIEELGIEYNLVLHVRNPLTDPKTAFRSPPDLAKVSPYGKSPFLITGPKDGSRPVAESSAIATYLIRTFDTEDKFGLRNGDWIRDEQLSSIALTDLHSAMVILFYLDFGPLKLGYTTGNRFDGEELRNLLTVLDRELVEGPKGGFFLGEHPGRADILFEYPMTMVKHRKWVDLKKEFPRLDEWLERVYARPAFKRSLEKGNGYDFSKLPNSRKL